MMRCLLNKHPLPAGVAIFSLVFICFAIASGGQVAVIKLKKRPADDIIPVISSFLGPGDTLSGQDYFLILKTTPENLTRIQSIVAHLDQASQQLAITVVQGENAIDQLNSVDISGSVTIGDGVAVGVGAPPGRQDDSITVDAQNSMRTRRSSDIQRVLVQNGTTATIYVGLSAPVAMESPTHKGMRVHQIEGYREMLTGVQVTPRISDNRVTLEIETRQDQPAGDGYAVVRSQQIQTQIQARLDEWIDIGSILGTSKRRADNLTTRSASRQSSQRHVFVKVTKVHP
jgi:hypothetical protein